MHKLLIAGLFALSVGLLPTAAHARPWHHHHGPRGPIVVVETVPVVVVPPPPPAVPVVVPTVYGPAACWLTWAGVTVC